MRLQTRAASRNPRRSILAAAVLAAGLMSCKEEPKYNFPPLPKAYEIAEGKSSASKAPAPKSKPASTAAPKAPEKKEEKPKKMLEGDMMIDMGDYFIDKYEASLVCVKDEKEIPHRHSERPVDQDCEYAAVSLPGVYPQAYISQPEAQAACKKAGERLCTLAEWTKACRGSKNTIYPYGNSFDGRKCHMKARHLLSESQGQDSKKWREDALTNPRLSEVKGFLTETGTFANCFSDYGVHDMVGNLQEWVSDRRNGKAVFTGCFYAMPEKIDGYEDGCLRSIAGHWPLYYDYSVGFRCCKDKTIMTIQIPDATKTKR